MSQPEEVPLVDLRVVRELDERGRDEVVAELFQRHYAALVRLAYVLLHNRYLAEDVVMEAFCALHARWSSVRNKDTPQAYLRSAVLVGSRSQIRELARERSRRPVVEVAGPDPSSDRAIAHDEARGLQVGVRALPERQREVVVCRYYLDLSETETVELLGISVGSVRRHAARARETLFPTLEGRPMNGTETLLHQALHSLDREVPVSQDDLAAAQQRFLTRRARQVRRRRWLIVLAAAATVAAVAAGGTLFFQDRDEPAAGPSAPQASSAAPSEAGPSLTPDDITGLWVNPGEPHVAWEFHADNTLRWIATLQGMEYQEVFYQVAGDVLDTGICAWRVRLSPGGMMTGVIIDDGTGRDCNSDAGDEWTWIRVSPKASVSASAFEDMTLSDAVPPRESGVVVGFWWREDTGHVLLLTSGADGELAYRLDDDGDIGVAPDDVGSAVLGPQGDLSLTTGAGPASSQSCPAGSAVTLNDLSVGTYNSRLWATPMRIMKATSSPGTCPPHTDLGGTWLKVS